MQVVTQNVMVELESEERSILNQAGRILLDLIDTIEKQNLGSVYLRELGKEYDIENLEDAKGLLFDLAEDDLELE